MLLSGSRRWWRRQRVESGSKVARSDPDHTSMGEAEVEPRRSTNTESIDRRSDEELMALWVASRRAGRGHDLAFRLLWKRHSEGVLRHIERALGSYRSLADEVFQEAWSEVTQATSYTPGVFRAFIRKIALRKAFDRLASAARHPAVSEAKSGSADDATEKEVDECQAETADPARAAQARQGARLILDLAAVLPELQRRAWVLRFVEQCTFEEIGAAMGTPVGTAKTRVRIASEAIRRGLRGRGVGWGDLIDDAGPVLEDALVPADPAASRRP